MHAHARVPLRTGHIRRAALIRRVPDAQLAVAVVAPALDSTSRHDHARVAIIQGDGDGGDAWRRGDGEEGGKSSS